MSGSLLCPGAPKGGVDSSGNADVSCSESFLEFQMAGIPSGNRQSPVVFFRYPQCIELGSKTAGDISLKVQLRVRDKE